MALTAAGAASAAGCTGGGGGSNGSSNGSGGSQGGPAGTLGAWKDLKLNEPKPVLERITGPEWIPPKYDKSKVADEVSHVNLGSMKNDPATKWYHDYFQKKTGITPKSVIVPSKNAVSKMTTLLSSGTAEPAMMQISQEFYMDFVAKGWLEPVDAIWNDKAFEPFPPYYQDQVKTGIDSSLEGEHMYASPTISEAHAMNYNPSLLEELGFSKDLLRKATWADIEEVCRAAQKHDQDLYGYVWYGKGNRFPIYPWMVHTWSLGGEFVKDGNVVVNGKQAVNALEWQRMMIDEGLVPDVTQYGQGGPQDLFLGERVVSFTAGTDILALTRDKWGPDNDRYAMGLPPKGKNGERVTYMNTDFLAITRGAPPEKKRASMVYMDGNRSAIASAKEYDMEGNYPSNLRAWDLETLADTPFNDVSRQIAKNAKIELWPKQIQTYDVLITQLQKCWIGQKKPKAALDAAQSEIESILSQS